jgi:GH43 family beta-xylosidase
MAFRFNSCLLILKSIVPAMLFLMSCSSANNNASVEPVFTGNPFLPGDFADPCILVHNDTFYVYATSGTEATVWRSADFLEWKLTKLAWPTSMRQPDIWAPAVTKGKDGRFYMYTSTNHNIYAGVADHPAGPFRNILGGDSIFIRNRQWWNTMHSIDADCFVDDDGQAYLYWGSGFDFKDGICAVGRLNDDMASFKEEPKLITPEGYFEGPHMMKRNGKYYLMYSDGLYYDSTYKVRYAVSDKPTGPFVQGKNSPILSATPDGKISGPGHHYTLKMGEDYFIVYHRHAYPFNEGIRQICIDHLVFEEDGSIKTVTATQEGVPLDFIKDVKRRKQLVPVNVYASSHLPNYEPQKAFDGSYGTLWTPNKLSDNPWITADYGEEISISAFSPVFERVHGAYQYKMEYSTDGQNWTSYPANDNGAATEWPVEHKASIRARYIKFSVINGPGSRQKIGLWELKVY